jgi:hypothetical protein
LNKISRISPEDEKKSIAPHIPNNWKFDNFHRSRTNSEQVKKYLESKGLIETKKIINDDDEDDNNNNNNNNEENNNEIELTEEEKNKLIEEENKRIEEEKKKEEEKIKKLQDSLIDRVEEKVVKKKVIVKNNDGSETIKFVETVVPVRTKTIVIKKEKNEKPIEINELIKRSNTQLHIKDNKLNATDKSFSTTDLKKNNFLKPKASFIEKKKFENLNEEEKNKFSSFQKIHYILEDFLIENYIDFE